MSQAVPCYYVVDSLQNTEISETSIYLYQYKLKKTNNTDSAKENTGIHRYAILNGALNRETLKIQIPCKTIKWRNTHIHGKF